MRRPGFTVIELLIIIAIMGILLVVGVVNLRGVQVNARDTERKTDIESIQMHLESFYKSGDSLGSNIGTYPTVDFVDSHDTSVFRETLRDIDMKSLTAPGADDPTVTFIGANNATQTTAGIDPQPTISEYVYQPIDGNGYLCAASLICRKYNLYYRLEADNTVYMVTSKNQ